MLWLGDEMALVLGWLLEWLAKAALLVVGL